MVNKLIEALGDTLEGFKKIPGLGGFIDNIQTTSFIPTIDPDTQKTINNNQSFLRNKPKHVFSIRSSSHAQE